MEASVRKSTNVRTEILRGGIGLLSAVAPGAASAMAERLFLTPRRYQRPAGERALIGQARRLMLPTPDGCLATWQWGGEGPRVLLVHGWEGRGTQLGAFVEPLVAAGFRVVAFDAPAHGDSPGARSSLFQFAAAVRRADEDLGPFHAIITHSMGGAAALWASRHGPLAERMVMIAPPVDLRDFTRAFAQTLNFSEPVRQRLHQRLDVRFGVSIGDVRAERLAAAMSRPLLVIHDEDDREVPLACGEAIAHAWPGAELRRTRGLGHRRILRDPDVVRATVGFATGS
jgi:pimeloyl-ACP methyl ester carboxylesterase